MGQIKTTDRPIYLLYIMLYVTNVLSEVSEMWRIYRNLSHYSQKSPPDVVLKSWCITTDYVTFAIPVNKHAFITFWCWQSMVSIHFHRSSINIQTHFIHIFIHICDRPSVWYWYLQTHISALQPSLLFHLNWIMLTYQTWTRHKKKHICGIHSCEKSNILL